MIVNGLEFRAEGATDRQLEAALVAALAVLEEAGVTPLEGHTAAILQHLAEEALIDNEPEAVPSFDARAADAWENAREAADVASGIKLDTTLTKLAAEGARGLSVA
jgi:hypothetical protein